MHRAIRWMAFVGALSFVIGGSPLGAQTREQKVRVDREKITAEGFWIYNDLAKGFAESKRTGKPLVVVLRCIPCEECVKLDDDLVDRDPVVRPLLDKFVCVRQVSTNGLDLAIFQFDTDQSFAMFFLNGDGTIYGRFGTRSHRTQWDGDVSLTGLAEALRGALDLHADYPANRSALAGKRGPAPLVASPELFPTLKQKYKSTLNYEGNVVASCIHCHQIGDAQRDGYRAKQEPIPDEVLFPYPHPKSIGLVLNSERRATVREVTPDSLAAQAGFRPGDEIEWLGGQPLLSIADVQWVLQGVSPQGGEVRVEIVRGDARQSLTIKLPSGWRRVGDLSWRSSSWGLRRMATGGLWLVDLTDDERREARLDPNAMGLKVKHVGQFGAHAAAKQAGVQTGDILVSFDGRTDLVRETDVLRLGVQDRQVGDRVEAEVLRGGKRVRITLPMQP